MIPPANLKHYSSTPFSEFQNARLGVEATFYLKRMIEEAPAHEPLLAALGGSPIALRQHIEEDLDRWKQNGMSPLFVFDGQSVVGKDSMALRSARSALGKTQNAWELYADNHPSDAVKTFGSSGATQVEDLYPILQDVLSERDLEFVVAPFSACAQVLSLIASTYILLTSLTACISRKPRDTVHRWHYGLERAPPLRYPRRNYLSTIILRLGEEDVYRCPQVRSD